jgi:uncharacterized protein YjiS (DUF1127 family)
MPQLIQSDTADDIGLKPPRAITRLTPERFRSGNRRRMMSVMSMTTGVRRRMLAPRVGAWLGRVAAAVASEWRLRRQVAFLLEQDDRMLRDLGLSRSDVMRVVRGGRVD